MHKLPFSILLAALLAALLLGACAANPPAGVSPDLLRPSPSAGQPRTPAPSPVPPTVTLPAPAPSQTPAAPTPTPTQPSVSLVPQERPLIAYQGHSPVGYRLVLLEPSGGGSFEFALPAGALPALSFLAGLSPDARYFACYTGGSLGQYGELVLGPGAFELHVYDLQTGEAVFSMPLLNAGFPETLKPLVALTEDEYWMVEDNRQRKIENMYYTMQRTVLDYLRRAAWSPVGELLAFASQDPGPSSDLFFFDPTAGAARKISSELAHVLALTWAPGSAALALETTHYDRHMARVTTDLLSPSGSVLASVEGGYFYGWHDPGTILVHSSVDYGDAGYRLRAVSAAGGRTSMLWEGSFDAFALAPDLSSLLFGSSQPTGPENPPGLFLKLPELEAPRQLSESVFWKVAYWGMDGLNTSARFAFAASAPDTGIFDAPQAGGTFGISSTGEMTRFDEGDWYLLPSPDGRYLAGYGPYEHVRGLRLFDEAGERLGTFSEEPVTCLAWNADSTALAYQVEQRLYLWTEGSGSSRLVASDVEAELPWRECGFSWVDDPR